MEGGWEERLVLWSSSFACAVNKMVSQISGKETVGYTVPNQHIYHVMYHSALKVDVLVFWELERPEVVLYFSWN